VRVVPGELTVTSGAGAQLAAQVNDAAGQPIGGARIVFSSADTRLVEVSDLGYVTSVGPVGQTSIRVASGGQQAIVPIFITAGEPQHVAVVRGDHQTAPAGTELPDLLQVRVTDANGNPVPGCRVRFTVQPATAAPVNAVCDSSGAAQARITLPDNAGPVTVTAVADANARAQATFTLEARSAPQK
jgi:Bacterial Ig-like domain (group 1)